MWVLYSPLLLQAIQQNKRVLNEIARSLLLPTMDLDGYLLKVCVAVNATEEARSARVRVLLHLVFAKSCATRAAVEIHHRKFEIEFPRTGIISCLFFGPLNQTIKLFKQLN